MSSRTFYLNMVCSIAMMGGIMFGFDIAIVAGAVPFIQEYFSWNELELGWGVSSLLIGCIIGAFSSGSITAKYGRKKVLLVVSLIFGISCAGSALVHNSTLFILMRLLGGLSVGAISVLSPMYVAEVAPAKIRGRMTALYQLCIMAGILISYFINFLCKDLEYNWRWMFGSGTIPSVLFFIGILYIPESPRWLVLKGRIHEATIILNRMLGSGAKESIEEIKTSVAQTQGGGKLSDLFKRQYRNSFWVGLVLAVLVQLIGCNAALDYAPKIMMFAGLSINDALFFNIFMGVINLIATFVGVLLMDRLGRRALYIFGSTVMAISLFMLGFSFHHELPPILLLVTLFSYIACFSACIGPAFWTLIAEMFPNRIRSQSVAFMSFVQWIFNFLVVWLFPHFLSSMGGAVTFYFFGVMCAIQLVVSLTMVKETKGKSLEQVEAMWNDNLVKC